MSSGSVETAALCVKQPKRMQPRNAKGLLCLVGIAFDCQLLPEGFAVDWKLGCDVPCRLLLAFKTPTGSLCRDGRQVNGNSVITPNQSRKVGQNRVEFLWPLQEIGGFGNFLEVFAPKVAGMNKLRQCEVLVLVQQPASVEHLPDERRRCHSVVR